MVSSKAQKVVSRARAAQLFDLGWSVSMVAKELAIGRSTAGHWRKECNENKDAFVSRPSRIRKARASKYSARDVQEIQDFAASHPRTSYRSISYMLRRLDIDAGS